MCEARVGKGVEIWGAGEWGGDLVPEQGCVLQSLVWLWGPWHSGSPGAEPEQLRPRVWMPPSQGAEQADQGPHRPQTLDTVRKSQVHHHGPRKDVAGDGARAGWSCVACRVLTEASPTPTPPGLPQTVLRAAPALSASYWAGCGWRGAGDKLWDTPHPWRGACPKGPPCLLAAP